MGSRDKTAFAFSVLSAPNSRDSDNYGDILVFRSFERKIVVHAAWKGIKCLTCQTGRYILGLADLAEGPALVVIAVRSVVTEKYHAGTVPDTAFPVYIRQETTADDRSLHFSVSLTVWNDWRHLYLVFQRIEQRKLCAMTRKPKLSRMEIRLQIVIDHIHGRYYWVMGRVPSMWTIRISKTFFKMWVVNCSLFWIAALMSTVPRVIEQLYPDLSSL